MKPVFKALVILTLSLIPLHSSFAHLLHKAVRSGDTRLVIQLLNEKEKIGKKIDFAEKDENDNTVFDCLFERMREDERGTSIARGLLIRDPSLCKARDKVNGYSILHYAVLLEDLDLAMEAAIVDPFLAEKLSLLRSTVGSDKGISPKELAVERGLSNFNFGFIIGHVQWELLTNFDKEWNAEVKTIGRGKSHAFEGMRQMLANAPETETFRQLFKDWAKQTLGCPVVKDDFSLKEYVNTQFMCEVSIVDMYKFISTHLDKIDPSFLYSLAHLNVTLHELFSKIDSKEAQGLNIIAESQESPKNRFLSIVFFRFFNALIFNYADLDEFKKKAPVLIELAKTSQRFVEQTSFYNRKLNLTEDFLSRENYHGKSAQEFLDKIYDVFHKALPITPQ